MNWVNYDLLSVSPALYPLFWLPLRETIFSIAVLRQIVAGHNFHTIWFHCREDGAGQKTFLKKIEEV